MADLEIWRVPRCWQDQTVVILGGGHSLTKEQVDQCRSGCRVIATNWSYQLAPWADWLWGADACGFWRQQPDAVRFKGTKIVLKPDRVRPGQAKQLERLQACGVKVLRHGGPVGTSRDPSVVTGDNAIAHILSIIAHTGARRVALLGADMWGGRWHDRHDGPDPNYGVVMQRFPRLAADLQRQWVRVWNCTPGSALQAFSPATLDWVLRPTGRGAAA